mgnify:CR=1 FL=1
MPGLIRLILAIVLLVPACGPGDNTTASDESTSVGPTSADTTASSAGTTTNSPTTGEPPIGTTGDPPVTTTGTTGSAGNCDPFPEEGQPCPEDGEYCGGGCEDQCQFCNILMCSEGTWHRLEAPPAPCLSCDEICPFTVMPMCANGPPDQPTCVTGCMDVMAGPCNIEFSATRACAGFMPTFTCDAMDRPTVAGCEAQFDALYACLGI